MTAERKRLISERPGYTQVFRLAYSHKDGRADIMHFYFTANVYEDGKVGEVFIHAGKIGSLASGVLDACGTLISMLLQYGVPLEEIIGKLRHMRFTPEGMTANPEIPICSSPLDLLAQWLKKRFLPDPQDVKTP